MQEINNTLPEFLTITEAAQLLRVSKVTIHSWINTKVIKAYKIGRRTLLVKSKVFAAIMKRVPK
jgi:excisionase family DNA binding protein